MKDNVEKNIVTLYWLTILNNAVPLICFTILAILFEKWWLALFSILFYKSFNFNCSSNKKDDKNSVKEGS